jgi:dipeptidyl aminopeptidase/acylaminoacyl peptidase
MEACDNNIKCLTIILTTILMAFFHPVIAQKKTIDTSVFGKWPSAESAVISSNGVYVSYIVNNQPLNSNTLYIRNIDNGWSKSYINADGLHFSKDSKSAFFHMKDTLYLLALGEEKPKKKIVIQSCISPKLEGGEWIAYEPKEKKGQLTVLNLLNGQHRKFDSVKQFKWEDHGKALLLVTNQRAKTALQWVDIPSLLATQIWTTDDSLAKNFSVYNTEFDNSGNQLTFFDPVKDRRPSACVWYYQRGAGHALKLADEESEGVAPGLQLFDRPKFSRNGHWVFFRLQNQAADTGKAKPGAAQVDVYFYKDMTLQSQQPKRLDAKPTYLAVVPVSGGPVVQLEREVDGENRVFTLPGDVTGDYVVLGEKLRANFKPWWLTQEPYSFFLVSLKNGRRTLLKEESNFPIYGFSFSPDGKRLIYWDSKEAGYMRYDLHTGKIINLTTAIPGVAAKGDYVNMFGESTHAQPVGGIKWIDSGKAFLTNDLYDIWKIDALGKIPPVNLSRGYGAKHHIVLRLVDQDAVHTGAEKVLVSGFNIDNKENGFYQVELSKAANPLLLTLGPYRYLTGSSVPPWLNSFSGELQPVKAKDANAWIISRETASEYPNYYYTRDWKKIIPLTDLQPQKDYNWLTSELVNYKQLDGTPSQGILYRPENFDPKKKYPVIFHYYEQLSDRLHEFPYPSYSNGDMNIPWFVSRGYLVFTPDNHYTIASHKNGKTIGEAVLNSVAGAARYLATLPYVDGKHMGIEGHSFGGGETNYLVTHSKFFAAACSAAGTVSDQVSAYLGPYRPKGGNPNFYRVMHSENGHDMIGATLWQRPDLYFRSSSVFNANHVTAPLLLMHNEKDEQTDWGQSFELFTALTRLGKPVWLLQYDGEGHVLDKEEDQRDFTIRLTQFFDHYLKGAPAPKWMIEGIPASKKGIDDGYELEPGKEP